MAERSQEPTVYGATDLSYNDYLKVSELLELQVPQSDPPHHDEMLFIIIHQAYELWFKLILHELDTAMDYMRQAQVLRARHFVHRVVEIMKLLQQQIHILETMTPAEFSQFRDRLKPASGFQSVQFREMEFVMGLKQPAYLKFFEGREEARATLQARLDAPDLRDAFYAMLRGLGYELPKDVSTAALEDDEDARAKLYEALLPIYRDPSENLPLYLLAESLVELDETVQLWREHHVRVVERIIGHKVGTGGSSGVEYLKTTTGKQSFPHLWKVRTYLEDSG